jgi:GDPmannose 4,6-dehydratase
MSKNRIAFITGCTGQDGSYLCELLLAKGYTVHGLIRRASTINTHRIDHIYQDPHELDRKLILHYGDMTDSSCLFRLISSILPDEVYNLAAMSHVKVSFDNPEYTADVDGLGTLRLLEACRSVADRKQIRIYQASTSELYGGVYQAAQNEDTPFYPRSPYAAAKLFAYWTIRNYRDAYDLFAVNGILFNHTSPRRGETFVEQKIVQAAAKISQGKQDCLYLGNIYASRDLGHAKDYVRAMWMMLQTDVPSDYVIATGRSYQVKDLVDMVFEMTGMPLVWHGTGQDEYASHMGRVVVRIDPKYYRPTEVDNLLGDASKARRELGWTPTYDINGILREMIDASLLSE